MDDDNDDTVSLQLTVPPKNIWYKDSNTVKLITLLVLVGCYMIVEIVFGYITNSLALLSDGYHMLSDALALAVGLVALRYSIRRSHSETFSYGWQRADTLGGLVNGVFLLAICLFITIEAISRFVEISKNSDYEILNPLYIVWVSIGGVAVNIIGIIMFIGQSHGHGHSHGNRKKSVKRSDHNEEHSHDHNEEHCHDHNEEHSHDHNEEHSHDHNEEHSQGHSHDHSEEHSHDHSEEHSHDPSEEHIHDYKHDYKHDHKHDHNDEQSHDRHDHGHHGHGSRSLNLRAVFLHLLGDLLGSIAAIASGLCIHFIHPRAKFYIDPALSLLIVAILLFNAIPLVRSCVTVLMQKVPSSVQLSALKHDLEEIPNIISLHELHVWQLKDDKSIGSVHVTCLSNSHFAEIVPAVKKVFHKYQVHSSTVQAEFLSVEQLRQRREKCQAECGKDCSEQQCCPVEYDDGLGESEIANLLGKNVKKRNKHRKK